ncbi:MAG: hypothetical protein LBS86_06315, partial [Treponema sp.]|nr:hypothetical protein [Treponema sp.]
VQEMAAAKPIAATVAPARTEPEKPAVAQAGAAPVEKAEATQALAAALPENRPETRQAPVVETPAVVIRPVPADSRFQILGFIKDANNQEYLYLKDSRAFGPVKVCISDEKEDPGQIIQHGEDTYVFKLDTTWYSITKRR